MKHKTNDISSEPGLFLKCLFLVSWNVTVLPRVLHVSPSLLDDSARFDESAVVIWMQIMEIY